MFIAETLLIITGRALGALLTIASTYFVTHYFSDMDLVNYYLINPLVTAATMLFISPVSVLIHKIATEKKIVIIDAYFLIRKYIFVIAILMAISILFVVDNIHFKIIASIFIFLEVIIGTRIGYTLQSYSQLGNHKLSTLLNLYVSLTLVLIPLAFVAFTQKNFIGWIQGLIIARMLQIPVIYIKITAVKAQFIMPFGFKNLINDNKKTLLIILINLIISWMFANYIKILSSFSSIETAAAILFFTSTSLAIFIIAESIFRSYIDRFLFLMGSNAYNTGFRAIDIIYLTIALVTVAVGPFFIATVSSNRFPDYILLSPFIIFFEVTRGYCAFLLSIMLIKNMRRDVFFYNIVSIFFFISIVTVFFSSYEINRFNLTMLYVILIVGNFIVLHFIRKRIYSFFHPA